MDVRLSVRKVMTGPAILAAVNQLAEWEPNSGCTRSYNETRIYRLWWPVLQPEPQAWLEVKAARAQRDQSGCSCCSMYRRRIAGGAPPQVMMQYDRLQRTGLR